MCICMFSVCVCVFMCVHVWYVHSVCMCVCMCVFGVVCVVWVEPNEDMIWFERVTLEIMKDALDTEIPIIFVKSKEVTDLAWMAEMFGCFSLTFNTSRLGKQFFKQYKAKQIALVIHELAHKDADVENGFSHLSHKYIDETIRIGSVIAEKGIQYYIDKVGQH